MAIDSENAGICECKYTEVPFDEKELKDLQDSALCIKQPNKFFMIFSKNGITSGVRKQIENDSNYSIIILKICFKKCIGERPSEKYGCGMCQWMEG